MPKKNKPLKMTVVYDEGGDSIEKVIEFDLPNNQVKQKTGEMERLKKDFEHELLDSLSYMLDENTEEVKDYRKYEMIFNSLWSWISTNFVPKEEVEKERERIIKTIEKKIVPTDMIGSYEGKYYNVAIYDILKELQDKC